MAVKFEVHERQGKFDWEIKKYVSDGVFGASEVVAVSASRIVAEQLKDLLTKNYEDTISK